MHALDERGRRRYDGVHELMDAMHVLPPAVPRRADFVRKFDAHLPEPT